MTRYARGTVVVRAARYGVVWTHDAAGLVLLDLCQPRDRLVHDVLLELSDLIACGAPVAHAVIRPQSARLVPAEGYQPVGAVPGATMCLVVQGMIRATRTAQTEARWSGHEAHRALARELCERR
jgi:hypothetical protein